MMIEYDDITKLRNYLTSNHLENNKKKKSKIKLPISISTLRITIHSKPDTIFFTLYLCMLMILQKKT